MLRGRDAPATAGEDAGATAATETNLMEKIVGTPLLLSGDKVTIPIHPFEILSLQVDYPHQEAIR